MGRGRVRAYADVLPHVFHRILLTTIRNQGSAVVLDISADEEVWNFPAYHYETELTLAEELADGGRRYAVETTVYDGHDGVSESILGVNELVIDYTYDLVTDAEGRPTGGEWTGDSVDEHPDCAWMPIYNPTGQDRGENPRLLHGRLLELLPADHAHGPRDLDLLVAVDDAGDVARASDRIEELETTTWTNPLAVTTPVHAPGRRRGRRRDRPGRLRDPGDPRRELAASGRPGRPRGARRGRGRRGLRGELRPPAREGPRRRAGLRGRRAARRRERGGPSTSGPRSSRRRRTTPSSRTTPASTRPTSRPGRTRACGRPTRTGSGSSCRPTAA